MKREDMSLYVIPKEIWAETLAEERGGRGDISDHVGRKS